VGIKDHAFSAASAFGNIHIRLFHCPAFVFRALIAGAFDHFLTLIPQTHPFKLSLKTNMLRTKLTELLGITV
jgi:hypothetical protein